MASKANLKDLFHEWNELNSKTQELMGNFDFENIKKIRKSQKKIEDTIYDVLKENAPDNIKKILPEDCGEMEVGYDTEGETFYFVMIDSEKSTDDNIKLDAITIDTNKKIEMKVKDKQLEIKCEKLKANLKGLLADDFPIIHKIKDKPLVKIKGIIFPE